MSNVVYEGVKGWEAFEPALSNAETMPVDTIWQCVAGIPEEWCEGDKDGLQRVVETLFKRRSLIRRLISIFGESSRKPFPNWQEKPAARAPSQLIDSTVASTGLASCIRLA